MQHKKLISFILILIITPLVKASAKEGDIFAPFVSRLTATADSKHITLTWKNPADLVSYKLIYRHTAEINEQNFFLATQLARVAPEIEAYIDTPPQANQEYYYAVLLEDNNKSPYKIFIPYRNKTSSGIKLETKSASARSYALISNIKAEVKNSTIYISFTVSDKSRELIVFRNLSPLINLNSINQNTFSQKLLAGTEELTDYPIAGVDYYYAVLDAEEYLTGKSRLILGQNTTVNPVQIPLSQALRSESSTLRTAPLPAPSILYDLASGSELLPPLPFLLPPKIAIDKEIDNKIEILLNRLNIAEKKTSPEVLSIDVASNASGLDKELQTIVKEYLNKADYREAISKLSSFLGKNPSAYQKARAHYYLGQAYYFRGQFQQAVFQFLLAQEFLKFETSSWLDNCLEKLYTEKKLR